MTVKEEKKEEINYVTIGDYFKSFLDNKECRVLKAVFDGQQWGANERTKRMARISLALPKEICYTNLKDLENWHLILVAIPMKEIEKLQEKEKQKEDHNERKDTD